MRSSPVRVLLIGAAGRMGKTISDLAKDDPKIDIIERCDLGDPIEPAMRNCEVAIDFSHAGAITEICRVALQHRKPLVIGTTGHSTEQRTMIEETAQSLPIVFASNFSIGVNVLFWLTRKAVEQLGGNFDVAIVETHHKMKKDAPSGTAKTLAEVLKETKKTAPASASSSHIARRAGKSLRVAPCAQRNGLSASRPDFTRCRMRWDCKSVAAGGDFGRWDQRARLHQ